MFKPNALYFVDSYKVGHKAMLQPGTTFLYGTWIPRSTKHAPDGITKIVSAGQQLTVQYLHDLFEESFFKAPISEAVQFVKDIQNHLGLDYDGQHFLDLHRLGYLPVCIKALPEGIETLPNVPHMTFVNTESGYAWLTLFLETIISALSWKTSTNATIALLYKRNAKKAILVTDKDNIGMLPYMCHDFSSRGLDPFTMITSGIGHAMVFEGSDNLVAIPASRYFYNEPLDTVCIKSVVASEHSVSTTKIFTVGEKQMIIDWLKEFPTGILSIVADTFDLWQLISYLGDPEIKSLIMARDGKLVVRPDSGDPVDIICGVECTVEDGKYYNFGKEVSKSVSKGVIELLWDIFGGTTNDQGYKVLDSHIGAIYGDSITPVRQVAIYNRLAGKEFAATNIVLGIGSYTYQYNTRDTNGFAAKGSWFICDGKEYSIYKDPITDDGTKKSLKGLCMVYLEDGEYKVKTECDHTEEQAGFLRTIYDSGNLLNRDTLTNIRIRIDKIL